MLLWFFGSPVIYDLEMVPDWLLKLYLFNPFTVMALLYRSTLLSDIMEPQNYWLLLASIIWAACSLYLGIRVFYRFENAIVKEL